MSGAYNPQSENNPDVAETEARLERGLAQLPGAAGTFLDDTRRFIQENGAAVLDGHTPVNFPPPEFMTVGTGDIFDAGT